MVEMIPGLQNNVIGLTAKTPFTRKDYTEVLRPSISATLAAQGSIRLLFILGPLVTPVEARAMWANTKLGLKHMAA